MDTLTLQPRMDGIPREAFAALLSRQILRYTRFQSCSVRTETAEQIARSILYALSALSAEEPGCSLADLDAAYSRALAYLRRQIQRCRFLYAGVRASRLPAPLLSYQRLIDRDSPDFLRGYDPEFHAAEEAMFPLYPLRDFPETGSGILYLREYLIRLFEENRACAGVPPAAVRAALQAAGKRLGQPGAELTVNLAEILLDDSVTFSL